MLRLDVKGPLLLLFLAACGPDDIPGSLDVTTARCTITGAMTFTADVEADVSIEVGQRASIDVIMNGLIGSGSFRNSYVCGAWTDDATGADFSNGCRRDAGQPADAHIKLHFEETWQASLPASAEVEVLPILFDGGRSEEQGSMIVPCTP